MLQPMLAKNDRRANILIFSVSIIVFVAVTALSSIQLQVPLPFDVHYFAFINAVLNTAVAILLVAALLAVKSKHFNIFCFYYCFCCSYRLKFHTIAGSITI